MQILTFSVHRSPFIIVFSVDPAEPADYPFASP
jgi:hypothetical protein